MELGSHQEALLPGYLASFGHLIGDQRTRVTFEEVVRGIIRERGTVVDLGWLRTAQAVRPRDASADAGAGPAW